ncbi:MAG TPA: organic hydroperoxide resistance protein [Stackebrandtia sp.]|uniref:organic hydroperoxide resistance protein n=1 Tax=Stackebrandtia sp. TaxID=2023065 RepID=UPI002D722DD2|nr:organic hydroperoxide resistance protein [Stackebrandtia sp.]HZE37393.1 organic hydroperoxide resistance protein [Stackebrandtia sp.]
MKTLYTAHATATGAGRNGHVSTDDKRLDFDLAMPTALGGAGGATNPEQLFAAGYASCFHSALQHVARQHKVDLGSSTVAASVDLGSDGDGFGLAVALTVVAPDLDAATAQDLADKAHQTCPYSKATRGNIDVTVTVAKEVAA